VNSRIAVAVVVAALLAVAGASGVAVAQEQPDTTTTAEANSSESDVVAEVDGQVRVAAYEYDSDREVMSVTVEHVDEAGSTASLTFTEVIDSRDGSSGSFGVEQLRLRPGETATVHVNAKQVDGTAAVMIVSQESLSEGRGVFVKEGKIPSSLFDGRPTWGDVRAAAFFGIVMSIFALLIASWYQIASKETGYQEAEI